MMPVTAWIKSVVLAFLAVTLSSLFTIACNKPNSSTLADYPLCSPLAQDDDRDGWGWEYNRSCRVPPYCSSAAVDPDGDGWGWEYNQSCRAAAVCASAASDPDGDGWGWENSVSCKVKNSGGNSPRPAVPPTTPSAAAGGRQIKFSTTYYPYRDEHYFQTVCGDANAHGGLYFAVTENSPLWPGSCENDSWGDCSNGDCLGKWDRLPTDVKRVVNGQKKVREPRCNLPCGKPFTVYSEDRSMSSRAVIYDACPSQHWNNRFKEDTEGVNPCASGKLHVDLRKPLYLKLNKGQENGNINVWIDVN